VSGLVGVVIVYKSSLKMVAALSNCAVPEQKDRIRFFLWSEDVKTSEIYRRMLA
jgi:hypothetical protein